MEQEEASYHYMMSYDVLCAITGQSLHREREAPGRPEDSYETAQRFKA